MSLRKKTLLILCLTLAGLIGGAFIVASRILLNKFEAADIREAEERVARARDLVLETISVLDSKTGDWASWDDSYAYMAGRNPGFTRANVTDKSFREIKASVMVFIAPSGRIVFSRAFDLARDTRRPAFEGLEVHVGAASPLLDHPDENSRKTGLVLLPDGPLLVAARPILTGEGKGPARGTLVFGRLLSDVEVRRLSQLLRHSLTVHRLDDAELARDLGDGRRELLAGKPLVVKPMDARSIAGFALLRDIHGQPAVILRVLGPRPMYGESRSSLIYLLISLVVVGLGFAAVSLALMEATVLARLARLTAGVQRIGTGGGRDARVRLAGRDELTRLATTVNAMLDAVDRAREAERESQRALATLMANLPGLAYRCRNDERWTMEFVSEGSLALTGYASHELTQNARVAYGDLIHPDDRRAVWASVQTALGTRASFELTYRIRTASGGEKWVWERGQGVYAGPAQSLEAIEGFITDVSDQVRMRKQLETVGLVNQEIARELDIDALLELIHRRAVELLGATGGSLYLWDDAAQVLVPRVWHGIPDTVGSLTLRSGEGLAGTAVVRRTGLIVNDYRAWPHAHPRYLAETAVVAAVAEPLLYHERLVGVIALHSQQPGRVFVAEDRALLALLAQQAAIAIQNASLFASAQQAMDNVQRAQAELVRSETLRGLGQMAAGIAHDLNNTLATILGQVEIQKLRVREPAVREGLALLETAALDGAQTVQRLLHFARPRGTSPLEPVDLADVVREVAEITRPRWKDEPQRHGLTIRLVLDLPDLPKIVGNPPELREVVTNLIFNAVDAMPHGGTLTLTGSAHADTVTLTVRDTGIGMPPEIQARVFEPFFTTKGVRGTGLGLASVYGIVERFGGRVAATSAVGQGTTFTLTFRRANDEAPAGTHRQPTGFGFTRRVVVVDDEPAVRRTIAALLEAMGHAVTEAGDGAAALRIVAEATPDLVVTDLGMPEMNGWEVARAVKAARSTLPVVLLTGWQDTTPSTQAEREPVDRILGKPVRLDALQQAIAELTARPPGDAEVRTGVSE